MSIINNATLAVRKLKAKGYKCNKRMPKLNQIPKRTPDIKLNAKSYSNKAFVYRLAEDNNPMHIDPKF